MKNKLVFAAIEGFKNPFRLTFALVAAVVAAFMAFVMPAHSSQAHDSRIADHKDHL